MMIDYKRIAKALITASEEILIEPNKNWFQKKYPSSKLEFRVGSGKSTYFRPNYKTNGGSITYGTKMIESCLQSYQIASGWTHGKEIIDRKYYDGVLTPHNCLAAVALHEVAHYYQHLIYERRFGSVHNKEFYKILDKMHANGKGEEILKFLMKYDFFSELDFELKNNFNSDQEFTPIDKTKMKKGDYFYYRNRDDLEVLSCATRVNSRTVSTMRLNIPYSRIIRIVDNKDCPKFIEDLKNFQKNNKIVEVKIGDKIEVKSLSEELKVYKIGVKYVMAKTFIHSYKVPKHLIIRVIK